MIMNAIGGGGGGADYENIILAGGNHTTSATYPPAGNYLSVTGAGKLHYCGHYFVVANGKPVEFKVIIDDEVIYHIKHTNNHTTGATVYGGIVNPELFVKINSQNNMFGPIGVVGGPSVYFMGTPQVIPYTIGEGLKETTTENNAQITPNILAVIRGAIPFKRSLVINFPSAFKNSATLDIGYSLDD